MYCDCTMCRNDKDCLTSGEMTDAKYGGGKTDAKRKVCQRDFSNAMEIVRAIAAQSYEQKAKSA